MKVRITTSMETANKAGTFDIRLSVPKEDMKKVVEELYTLEKCRKDMRIVKHLNLRAPMMKAIITMLVNDREINPEPDEPYIGID